MFEKRTSEATIDSRAVPLPDLDDQPAEAILSWAIGEFFPDIAVAIVASRLVEQGEASAEIWDAAVAAFP